MRVLMTTDTVGGVWTFTRELVSGLLARGCAVALVSLGALPMSDQQVWLEQTESSWGSNFRYAATNVALEWMQDNRGAYSDAAPLLLQVAEEFEPDLLLSSQFCFGALPVHVPRIVVAHSDVMSWADACRDGALENSEWLDRYLRLVGEGLDAADAVVAPTQWMMDALSAHFSIPAEHRVIPNGRRIRPVAAKRVRKLQAITAGRLWDEAKNAGILCGIDSPMPLLVAGSERHDACSARQARAGMQYLGRLSEDELHRVFHESAIYICTSRYEPFGLAPLEAALCGCAVVANDIPSLREVWENGARYFKDAPSLAGVLDGLSRNSAHLAAAQRKSYERALTYSAEAMTDGYLGLFVEFSRRAEAYLAA